MNRLTYVHLNKAGMKWVDLLAIGAKFHWNRSREYSWRYTAEFNNEYSW